MSINKIYPFAQPAVPPQILDDLDYSSSSITTTTGYPAGSIASSAFMSKAQRQSSAIAAGVGQFLADYQAVDVEDNLSPAAISAMFSAAIAETPLVTQPQFDDSLKSATTGFVQRALGSLSSSVQHAANAVLTNADIGKVISPTNASLAFELPLVAGLPDGAKIAFNGNTNGCVVAGQGADVIVAGTSGVIAAISIKANDQAELTVISGVWNLTGGEAHQAVSSSFEKLLAGNGYQTLPGGLILQWVKGMSTAGGILSAPWPKPFPTALLSGWANEEGAQTWGGTNCTVWGFAFNLSGTVTAHANVRSVTGGAVAVTSANGTIFGLGY